MIKKRYFIFVFLIFFLFGGIFIINAAVDKTKAWHSGDNIWVKIDNTDRTLQYAITNNLLTGSHSYASSSTTAGHSADQIWASLNGVEKTLMNFLSASTPTTNKLCDSSPGTLTTSYSSSPTDKSKAYHFTNQIEVNVGGIMSLQEAIDNGKFNPSNFGQNCPPGDANCINPGTIQCDEITCSGSYKASGTNCGTNLACDGNGNCVSTCVPNVGQSCDDGNLCTTGETTQCDGSCSGWSPVARGTNCEGGYKACDGSGNCLRWTGTGCDSCPWGKSDKLYKGSGIDVTYYVCILNGNQGRSSAGAFASPTSPPWSYSEENAAKCWQRQCSKMVLFWCTKHSTSNFNWQIKP